MELKEEVKQEEIKEEANKEVQEKEISEEIKEDIKNEEVKETKEEVKQELNQEEKYLIEIKNMSKIYMMGETEVHALNNVNLKIKEHEFVSIIGPSGSRKINTYEYAWMS